MIRASTKSELIDQYVEESRERFDHIESLASDIIHLLHADAEVPHD